ncbi:MAG: Gfo/Idh/MocA family oxidoreductase, partial [Gemmatimonadales bacterium]
MPALRGVVIGAGGVARLAHLPAYRHDAAIAAQLGIVGAVDPVVAPGSLGDLPVFRALDDAMASGPLDFVDICTPTATHRQLVLDSLARGLHVMCEKPVAVDPEVARELA